jgi:hypothetical protein
LKSISVSTRVVVKEVFGITATALVFTKFQLGLPLSSVSTLICKSAHKSSTFAKATFKDTSEIQEPSNFIPSLVLFTTSPTL